jgi:hypothetical protein
MLLVCQYVPTVEMVYYLAVNDMFQYFTRYGRALAKSLTKGEQVDVILLDFSKAFDKVPHHRLLHKLYYYGVRGNTFDVGYMLGPVQLVVDSNS